MLTHQQAGWAMDMCDVASDIVLPPPPPPPYIPVLFIACPLGPNPAPSIDTPIPA
jgi:hypothetical protein